MIKLFTHENRLILFNVKNLLEAEGIECVVRNEFSSGAVGDLAPFETWPEIWLLHERDLPRARAVVAAVTGQDDDSGRFEA